jgi:hypothetical protein
MNRLKEWDEFSALVRKHIEEYTIPQYGDMPEDLASTWSKQDCIKSIGKYVARHGNHQRQDQAAGDLKKTAHYACMAFFKE